ncbi:MAG: hypothetical protein ABIX01_05125 [Chitinophagaceae bacterium]
MKTVLKSLLVLPLAVMVLSSCSDYGKKIKVEGTKGEIYYKGEGVTESDAKKVGDYLKKDFFSNDKAASVQLTKDGDGYMVRFVYDKEYYEKTKGLEDFFKLMAVNLSKEVLGDKKVNIALSETDFKDFKSIPWDEAFAKAQQEPADSKDNGTPSSGGLADYDKEVSDGVTFYWKKPVTDAEAEMIGKAIIATGDFKGGTPETTNVIMEKEGDRYLVKYPVSAAYIDQPSTLDLMEAVSKKIKDAAFANVPFSFYMVDVNMKPVKSWDY